MKSLDPFKISFSGVHLIEASAGTGKTYSIASLYVRAIIEAGKTVNEILVVTYTEAATKELRDRLVKRLREAVQALNGKTVNDDSFLSALQQHIAHKAAAIKKLQKAIHSFDEAAIYTIHGFCRHALQERAFRSGAPFEVELIGDDTEIAGDIIDDYWRKWVQKASESTLRKPLLKLLLDSGYRPEKLTDDLANYAGKPYLQIRPENKSITQFDKKLIRLASLFVDLQQAWNHNQDEIFRLLNAGHLSYYRTDWLEGWMQNMDDWLQAEIAPISYFDKFTRFSQSYINNSLKKSSEKKGIEPPRHPFFNLVDSYHNIADLLQNFEVFFKRHLFTHLLEKLDDKKEELQVYSYDDLLVQLREALAHAKRGEALCQNLRQTYSVALVDEFQDTDPIQYQIFKAIYGGSAGTALFMIGDPKQSIYSFRGADIFAYLQAKKDAPAENTFSLTHNYRSVPSLLKGFNALFSFHSNPFVLKNISYKPVEAGRKASEFLRIEGQETIPVEIREWSSDMDEKPFNKEIAKKNSAKDTAGSIHQLLIKAQKGAALIGDKSVQARDIAVLVRSHRQATLISEALQDKGIKSVKHSRESVFNSDEARDFYTVLKALVEPGDERLVMAALSTSILGYTANELFRLKEDESAWVNKLEQFRSWHEQWQNHGFAFMFRSLMQHQNIADIIMQRTEGERILTNLGHLSELMQQKEQNEKLGLHSLLKWLLKKRKEDKKEIEEEQLRLESDENLVTVVTVHHSKGLEYPIVFCPFLWNAPRHADYGKPLVYHDPEDSSKVYLDFWGKNDPDRSRKRYLQAKETLAEDVRLAYVAVTRAKYKCVINWVHAKKSVHSPLGLLLLGAQESFKSLKSEIFSDSEYEQADSAFVHKAITQLAKHDSIVASDISQEDDDLEPLIMHSEDISLEASIFSRALPLAKGNGMTSFSSLVRHEHEDFELDYKQYYDDVFISDNKSDLSANSIFDFPKGPDPGTAVHHIFEDIDFTDSRNWDAVINEHLQAGNIREQWGAVVRTMLDQTINKPLIESASSFNLAAVKQKKMIPEMEFYFTIGHIKLKDLLAIIRPDESFAHSFQGFSEEGFLKGFIDLTFQYKNKFYILDYKTNHLGNSVEDYSKANLCSEMNEKLYDLQYHLYLVALHRFLERRYPGYRYEDHVGGAFYLFIRGMNRESAEGIYFDCPEAGRIKALDKYLRRNAK